MRALISLLLTLGTAQAAPVSVSGAWARATLPHQSVAVVYMRLQSPAGDVLTGADSPAAAMAMLHRSVRSGATQSMQDVESIPLPAGEIVTLAPNGSHIMLMDVKHALKPGDRVPLVLHFARAGAQSVMVPVRPVGSDGP